MASIDELKQRIDLHDLADKLGLERPGSKGNYKSPHHDDKSPSLSIYTKGSMQRWRDFSNDTGGDCIDLVIFVNGCEVSEAVDMLHDMYGIPKEPPKQQAINREKTRAEYIADKVWAADPSAAIKYLVGRGITKEIIDKAINLGTLGFNDWRSDSVIEGQRMHGGPACAFVVKSINPGAVKAVDLRYIDPGLNGGLKTMTQGDKDGAPWMMDIRALKNSHTVYIVESAINALSIEACQIPGATALATRGTATVKGIDWRFLIGKKVVVCMDADKPGNNGLSPGRVAAWKLLDLLIGFNIAAFLVDQLDWPEEEWNDINDVLQGKGITEVKIRLKKLEPWIIPGKPGRQDHELGADRIYLPTHDFRQYWRYRTREDFTSMVVTKRDQDGNEKEAYHDLCGFRVAGISRVTIASSTSTMTGDIDSQPMTQFSVSVQSPRHGNKLQRRVFEDERLHNPDQWTKFGPIFKRADFLRMVNILERGADLGARNAINFVGLAWRDGKPVVNEGPDCYFTEPEKQCPYHNLTFPSGDKYAAKQVIAAYQETFQKNAASLALVWSLGGHLKAFLGFWPHMVMQADKGAGKSTLIKRLERSISMTMFSRQSLGTEYRIVTSLSGTSHPIGWEEISAGRQDIIDKAVANLQEAYNYTTTRRGSDMTEFLISAPVLLAGEDVPVRSLIGKLVRTHLGKKGPMMREDLPKFPVLQWLQFLTQFDRPEMNARHEKARLYCQKYSRSTDQSQGATRMVSNYAALLTAWGLICDFLGYDRDQGDFPRDLVHTMNDHIAETSTDREPWIWILEVMLAELSSNNFSMPYTFALVDFEECLLIRTTHIMHHIARSMHLRALWDSLPVKSDRVFKRQLRQAGVLASDDIERSIGGRRCCHMVAINLNKIAEYGLYADTPDNFEQG